MLTEQTKLLALQSKQINMMIELLTNMFDLSSDHPSVLITFFYQPILTQPAPILCNNNTNWNFSVTT